MQIGGLSWHIFLHASSPPSHSLSFILFTKAHCISLFYFSPLLPFVTLVCQSLVSLAIPSLSPSTPVSLWQWELWGVTLPLRCALLPLYPPLSVFLTHTITHFYLSPPSFFSNPLPLQMNGVLPKAPVLPSNKPVNSVWHLSACPLQPQSDKWSAVLFTALSLSVTLYIALPLHRQGRPVLFIYIAHCKHSVLHRH